MRNALLLTIAFVSNGGALALVLGGAGQPAEHDAPALEASPAQVIDTAAPEAAPPPARPHLGSDAPPKAVDAGPSPVVTPTEAPPDAEALEQAAGEGVVGEDAPSAAAPDPLDEWVEQEDDSRRMLTSSGYVRHRPARRRVVG